MLLPDKGVVDCVNGTAWKMMLWISKLCTWYSIMRLVVNPMIWNSTIRWLLPPWYEGMIVVWDKLLYLVLYLAVDWPRSQGDIAVLIMVLVRLDDQSVLMLMTVWGNNPLFDWWILVEYTLLLEWRRNSYPGLYWIQLRGVMPETRKNVSRSELNGVSCWDW